MLDTVVSSNENRRSPFCERGPALCEAGEDVSFARRERYSLKGEVLMRLLAGSLHSQQGKGVSICEMESEGSLIGNHYPTDRNHV